MIELRWLTRDLTSDDMTAKEWGEWCRHMMDPEPGPIRSRVLQYRVGGGLWRDVPEDRQFAAVDCPPAVDKG